MLGQHVLLLSGQYTWGRPQKRENDESEEYLFAHACPAHAVFSRLSREGHVHDSEYRVSCQNSLKTTGWGESHPSRFAVQSVAPAADVFCAIEIWHTSTTRRFAMPDAKRRWSVVGLSFSLSALQLPLVACRLVFFLVFWAVSDRDFGVLRGAQKRLASLRGPMILVNSSHVRIGVGFGNACFKWKGGMHSVSAVFIPLMRLSDWLWSGQIQVAHSPENSTFFG